METHGKVGEGKGERKGRKAEGEAGAKCIDCFLCMGPDNCIQQFLSTCDRYVLSGTESSMRKVWQKMYPDLWQHLRNFSMLSLRHFRFRPQELGGHFQIAKLPGPDLYAREFEFVHLQKRTVCETDCIHRVELMIQQFIDLRHQNVMKIYKVFDDGDIAHVARGLSGRSGCSGAKSDLYYQIRSSPRRRLSESTAGHFFNQLLHGLIYLRTQEVVYKNIRPENMLITETSTLKICAVEDVMCCMGRRKQSIWVQKRDRQYMAPEMLQGPYGIRPPLVQGFPDLWSVGVMLHEMLCGFTPFHGGDLVSYRLSQTLQASRDLLRLSSEVKNLIRELLAVKPCERPTLADAATHEWVQVQIAIYE